MGRPGRGKSICKKKKRYTDLDKAKIDAIKLLTDIDKIRRVRIYKCPWCKFLHVTKGNTNLWVWQASLEEDDNAVPAKT